MMKNALNGKKKTQERRPAEKTPDPHFSSCKDPALTYTPDPRKATVMLPLFLP